MSLWGAKEVHMSINIMWKWEQESLMALGDKGGLGPVFQSQ